MRFIVHITNITTITEEAGMTTPLSDWVREVSPDLKKLDSIPLTGNAPPFPWDEFSSCLAKSLDRKGLRIQPGEISWRLKKDLYEGLGDAPFPLNFSVPSLKGQVSWVMPEQELAVLAALLLTKETHPLPLYDRDLNESFTCFLALEVLHHLHQVSFDKTLTPILTHDSCLPAEDALCLDISLTVREHTIWGRLIISPDFRRSWVDHFALQSQESAFSQHLAQSVSVPVHLEIGKVELTAGEWRALELGDVIILDSCSFDPEKRDGRITLTVDGKPTFRGKLKENTLKILELPRLL